MLDRNEQREVQLDHRHSGNLVAIASDGHWFAYPWWTDSREAPDFATHVDIHNKPGFDPCELFFGWPPPSISRDPTRVQGTHGRIGPDREIAWATSCDFDRSPEDLADLGRELGRWLIRSS